MTKKSYAILGLGKFGQSIALELSKAGAEVLAVDIDEERIQEIAPYITYAVTADICDTTAMDSLGLSNMDAVIVAITNSLDASVMATIYAKEAGVPFVLAKSRDEIHSRILEKVGADRIIIPEKSTGVRIARNIISGNFIDFIELSTNIRMIEIAIRNEWVNQSLKDLNLRKKYNINVIAIRQNGEIIITPDPDMALSSDISLLVIADKKDLPKLMK